MLDIKVQRILAGNESVRYSGLVYAHFPCGFSFFLSFLLVSFCLLSHLESTKVSWYFGILHLQNSLLVVFCAKYVTHVVLTWCAAFCSFVFLLLSADGSLQQKRLWMCAQRLKSTTVCLFIHYWRGDGFILKAGRDFVSWKLTYCIQPNSVFSFKVI